MEKCVYLYVLDTMADWEIGYLTAELNSGRYFRKGTAPLRVVTIGLDSSPIKTMGGLRVIPDLTVEECRTGRENSSALILPGGHT